MYIIIQQKTVFKTLGLYVVFPVAVAGFRIIKKSDELSFAFIPHRKDKPRQSRKEAG